MIKKWLCIIFTIVLAQILTAAEPHEVIIVGGGISGLTAAYLLKDSDILLLEKEDHVGGRTLSGNYDGLSYARGTEYLGKPYGLLKRLISDLDLKLLEIPSPMDAVFQDKHWYWGEEGILRLYIEQSGKEDLIRFIREVKKLAALYSEIPEYDPVQSEIARLDMITAAEWFKELKLPDIYFKRFNVASRGLFGASLDEVSALSFIPEAAFDLAEVDIGDIREFDGSVETYQKTRKGSQSYTLAGGIAEIPLAIGRQLGSKVSTNSTVLSVTKKDDIYHVTYIQNGKKRMKQSYSVIMATPAPVTLKLASNVLSQKQISILKSVKYGVYLTANLFSKKPVFDKAFDLAVDDGLFFTDIYDSTWIEKSFNKTLSRKSTGILGVYIAAESYQDRSIIQLTDKQVLARIYQDMESIFPDIRKEVTGSDIHRFEYAYPIMTPGAYSRLSELHKITDGSLQLAGDFMIYPTFEAAVESGELAVDRLLDWVD